MDFEITKREVLASISIIAIMILAGLGISGKITQYQLDKKEEYNKAAKITDPDLFKYGMETNIGNAFVEGKLKAVDTVGYKEIKGKYMYVKIVKEKYTRHTRTVRHSNGKHSYTTTETYWTWDYYGSESKKCKKVNFCGVEFPSKKIVVPSPDYIKTTHPMYHIRYSYYGTKTKFKGVIYTKLKNNTISDKSYFYKNENIKQVTEQAESMNLNVLFWVIWIMLIVGAVFGFYYLRNDWLE